MSTNNHKLYLLYMLDMLHMYSTILYEKDNIFWLEFLLYRKWHIYQT